MNSDYLFVAALIWIRFLRYFVYMYYGCSSTNAAVEQADRSVADQNNPWQQLCILLDPGKQAAAALSLSLTFIISSLLEGPQFLLTFNVRTITWCTSYSSSSCCIYAKDDNGADGCPLLIMQRHLSKKKDNPAHIYTAPLLPSPPTSCLAAKRAWHTVFWTSV
jgi:hypothetical protein